MSLISANEQDKILKEAQRQRCEGTRMNDPHWATGIVFATLGLIMVLSSLQDLTDSHIDLLAVNGIVFLFLALYHWGRWQRRKVICVLHGVLALEADECANGPKPLNSGCPDAAGGGLQT